jgi:nucleoside-diphosphate-sugar epimerase
MITRPDSETLPRVLLTGIHGFTGRYLAQILRESGHRVFGTVQGAVSGPDEFSVDLTDRAGLTELVRQVQPDWVVHLAAIAFVAHSDVDAMYRVNIVATRNLLEALAASPRCPDSVLLVSSANIYGNTLVDPITEQVAASPVNDYAVSKLAMEYMARLWMDRLPIFVVRPFNYTGIGQNENFLLPKIVGHYRRKQDSIELGNLDVARDFSDVRDVVQIYRHLLALAPRGQLFNVCSGKAHSLFEVLAMMQHIAGYALQVRVNPAFARANEVKRLVGSDAHVRATLAAAGIELPARIALQDTLRWMWQA